MKYNYNKARSFKSIGQELGITEAQARDLYISGMNKLKTVLDSSPELRKEWLSVLHERDSGPRTRLPDMVQHTWPVFATSESTPSFENVERETEEVTEEIE